MNRVPASMSSFLVLAGCACTAPAAPPPETPHATPTESAHVVPPAPSAVGAPAIAPAAETRGLGSPLSPPVFIGGGGGGGRLKNHDALGYDLELTCAESVYRARIEPSETVRFGDPATVGCRLSIARSQRSLTLAAPPFELQIKDGTPSLVERPLTWEIEMKTFGDADVWPQGAVRQWAQSATASSQYSPTSWNAAQASGAPNTFRCGDIATAWTTSVAASPQPEWLELTYAQAVRAEGARIVVTNAPGAVREVLARNGREWRSVWKGQDATGGCPGILVVRFRETLSTDGLRIVLDLTKQTTWFEVDAVELIGSPAF